MSTYNWTELINVDPVTEAETWAGELTVAPSAGELITTSVAELVTGGEEEVLAEVPGVALFPVALLPEAEPESEGVGAAPLAVVVPEAGVLLPAIAELADPRLGFVIVATELLKAPEPPHPVITAIKNKENKIAPCRIEPPQNGDWQLPRPIPFKEAMDASTLVTSGKVLRATRSLT